MNLSQAGRFFETHTPVTFPHEALATDFTPYLHIAKHVAQGAKPFFRRYLHEKFLLERTLLERLSAIRSSSAFERWFFRAAFTANLAYEYERHFGASDVSGLHRIYVLLQREMIEALLHLEGSRHADFITCARRIGIHSDFWEPHAAGARAVINVLIHMIQPNRLFFFPRITEDIHQKIDLIVIDVDGNGACLQIKGTKSIDGAMHIETLTEPPEDEYLQRFFEGTKKFNNEYRLKCRPVLFTVGW